MLQNEWIRDVTVRGEEELAEREAELASAVENANTSQPLDSPSAADALKPASPTSCPTTESPPASTSQSGFDPSNGAFNGKKKPHKNSISNVGGGPTVVPAKSQLAAPAATSSDAAGQASKSPMGSAISV